ncbi:MAG: amino acid adenylation domain-containing protein [Symploca sp. SIO3C6]|nr:amino acid adenylation domain-containing protein [Symploca sp. SIO3C6]
MKTIDELLSYFQSLDVRLWADGDQLHYNAPEGTLTPTLKSQLRERKSDIIDFLQKIDFASSSSINSILPIPRDKELPLSFAQQRLWFLQQLQPDSSFYNEYGALQLTGSLDIAAFEQSLNGIVRRHEAMCTTFKMVEGEPVQTIAPSLTLTLPVVDLCELPEAEQAKEVQRLSIEQSQRPFDLVQDPLFRFTLLQLNEQKYIWLYTIHHIVFDDWSVGVIIRELSDLYEAFSSGKPASLPELPIQYADFAVWQRQQLQGEKLKSQLSYWKQQLSNAPPLLQLPTDRPRPTVQTYRGAKLSFLLPKSLTEALKAIAQKAQATLFMILLSAFKLLLYRYSGQEDIIVSSAIANRNRAEIEGLIGFFVNVLLLRTDFSGNPTFEELLGQVRKVTIGAYANQDLPFEKLVEELQPERQVNYNPLFQVSFGLQNTPKVKFELPGLTLTPVEVEGTRALLDLRLDMTETDSGLESFWEYNIDLFDAATISRMSGNFQTLLEAIVENPQQRVSQLPLLSETEQHLLLREWNQTIAPYPKDTCIHQLFEAQVEKTPDAVAVVFEEQQLTYRELNQRANQLAHYLNKLGVKPEILVGICVERSLEMIVGVLGILKAGGAYLPLDPTYPAERLAFMLSDSQVPILLRTQKLVHEPPQHHAQVICLDADWTTIAQESEQNPDSGITVENLAYLIYTSGSTGKPKGVLVTHEGLGNLTEDKIRTCKVKPDSRILQYFSLSFDASIPELVMALGSGAALHLAKLENLLPGPALIKLLQEQAITHITLPPPALAVLPAAELPALQMVLVGGEAPSPELIAQWSKGRLFINAYGPTETTVNASMVECGNDGQKIPTVRPAANKQLYILDKHLQPVPIGVPGELHIGGVGLARGYLNRPEKTAEAFIPNPFSDQPGSRLYKTGDLACYLSDGHIKLLGRLDHQVKLRGFRIELGEIEAALVKHPAVRETLVLAREDKPGNKRLVAYVVANLDELDSNAQTWETQSQLIRQLVPQLRSLVKQMLPEYMRPSAFVILEALPLNPNGKVDRWALPVPDTARPELEAAFVAPRTPTEQVLAEIFALLLEVEQVGVHDDFFELGGHSLLATQLITQLHKRLEVEVTVIDLFKVPTVAGVAERIEMINDRTYADD